MKTETANRIWYPALDGIRGLAILLVVFYHNFGFIDYFFFGWLGVDLFFVLSGFLITDILIRTRNNPHFLSSFYKKRVLRIFPLYYLVLIIFLVVIPALQLPIPGLSYFLQNQLWLWLYLQNWLFIFKPPGSSTLLTPLWSLAVEEQYYLLWPFLILFVRNVKVLFAVLLLLLLGVISIRFVIWTYQLESLAYFNLYTFSRIDGICLGSMLALLRSWNASLVKKNTTLIVFILAAINFLFFFFNRSYHFSFPYLAVVGYTTFAVLFCLLVNEAITTENKFIDLVFNLPSLKFFGKISYSLYVFHWPIHLLLFPIILPFIQNNLTENTLSGSVVSSIVTTCAGVLISVFSYQYFEKIFLKIKNKIG